MRMATKAQRPASSDIEAHQINVAAHQSPKNNGSVSIAELRSRFQKDDGEASPVSISKALHHAPRPPVPIKPTNAAPASKSLPAADKQPQLIREMQQKFGSNNSPSPTMPSLPKKQQQQATNGNPHSSPIHGGVAAVTSFSTKPPTTTTKPLSPATKSNRPVKGSNHSPHKVGQSCKSTSSPKNTHASQPLVSSTANTNIRPNQSHLSSLISEIHQQQLQQQLLAKVYEPRTECEPLPRPPATVPPSASSTITPPSLQRKIPSQVSVELGPPPPVPLAAKPSPMAPPPASPGQRWRRRILPPLAELGPPPAKPSRPHFVKLKSSTQLSGLTMTKPDSTPPLPQRNAIKNTAALPLPPKLLKSVPTPPVALPIVEIHQLSSVMAGSELKTAPTPLIPEFTEEEELGDGLAEDFYDDTDGPNRTSSLISDAVSYSPGLTSQQEELYHDASIRSSEADDVYEDIGVAGESSRMSDTSSLTYGSKKESERQRREEERRLKREQKERDKKAREGEKIRKRFNLSGNEVPVYTGVVKESTKGRRREDLIVKQGDRVKILRIGENPSGKWLALNDDGKVGYVDLTNIEVMKQSKANATSASSADNSFETCDDEISEEAIYEEFA